MASEKPENMVANNEELIKKACSEAIKAHKFPDELFLEQSSTGSSEVIFSFPGSWLAKDWYSDKCQGPFGEEIIDLKSFPSIRSIGNQEAAHVNKAFQERFQSILENSKLKEKVRVVFGSNF